MVHYQMFVFRISGSNLRDLSTGGVLHSVGSDLTRTKGRSKIHQHGSIRSEHTVLRARDHGNTPTSRAEVSLYIHELFPYNTNFCHSKVSQKV